MTDGTTLADWMAAEEISDEALAASLNIDRSTASRIRRAKMLPSSTLIAEIFRISGGRVEPNTFFREPYPLPMPRQAAA